MSPSEPPILAPGAALAPGYEVVAHLRRGGSLDVYDLWSTERRCRCVGKAVRADRLDGRAPLRLEREARVLLDSTHPHLVRAYELADGPVSPVLVLETLTGATLGSLVEEDGPLEADELGHLGLQLCSAVGYLHRRGILHLDLKPDNVISAWGMAKVIDLSLARPPGPVPPGLGTEHWSPPEQRAGGEATAASDVYGIGVVLRHAAGDLPRAVAATLEACLAEAQAERPSLEHVVAALADLADERLALAA